MCLATKVSLPVAGEEKNKGRHLVLMAKTDHPKTYSSYFPVLEWFLSGVINKAEASRLRSSTLRFNDEDRRPFHRSVLPGVCMV